jgi:hypothetical protein
MKKQTQITALEAKLINAIAYHVMSQSNGRTPESIDDHGQFGTWLWLDDFAETMDCTVDQAKGVLTSIKKKGWVGTSEEGTEDAAIYFTDAGFAIFQQVDEQKIEKTCPVCGREFKSARAMRTHVGRSNCRHHFDKAMDQRMADELLDAEYEIDVEHHKAVTGEAPETAAPKCEKCDTELKPMIGDPKTLVCGKCGDHGKTPEAPKNICLCGCLGETKKKRLFLQGHDMKLKSRIKNFPETLVPEQIAHAKANWPTFWAKYQGAK